jgi:prephenate dehydrogenase
MAKLTVIGTGLIGTSLALAVRQANIKGLELVGTDSERSARGGAIKSKAFDHIDNHLASSVRDANIVVLATPVMAMKEVMQAIAGDLEEGAVVTDVGSSKKVVLEWAEEYLPKGVDFVGGHPMAGKETSGPENADAGLFQGKVYCVIPAPGVSQKSVTEITALVDAVGAKPFFLSVDEHDSFVAAASHLPFLLSVALIGCTSKSVNWGDIAPLASSGFEGSTRLASGDPVMHRDICLSNPEPIVAWIDAFIRELHEVRQMLGGESPPDSSAVGDLFEKAYVARELWKNGDVQAGGTQPAIEIPSMAESMFGTLGKKLLSGGREKDGERR